MKRFLLPLISILIIALLCSCKINIEHSTVDESSSSDVISQTETTTTPTSSQTTPQTSEPLPMIYSDKVFSKDGFFSLSCYVSAEDVNVNQSITIAVKFKNESNEDFKVGIENLDTPANIVILKKDEIWGYEGNDTALCSSIEANQEINQDLVYSFKEACEYQIFIFSDFARELKSYEDASTVDMNYFNEELANSSIMLETIIINVK